MVGCESFLFPNNCFPPKAMVAFRVTWLHCTMITSKYFGLCEHNGFFDVQLRQMRSGIG